MTYEYEPNDKFGYKDTLPEGHDEKIIKGSEFDDEFNKISNAFKVFDPDFDGDIEIDAIDGLQDALDGKADQSALEKEIQDRIDGDKALQDQIDALDPDGDRTVDWSEIEGKPAEFPPEAHNQDWGTITGKPADYPPSSHGHAWGEITGTPSEYPPEDHTHDQYALAKDLEDESKARVEGDAALAQDITDLEAAVGGVSGQLAFGGSYDANTGLIVKSNLSTFVEGQSLPDYSTVEGKFVIVAVAGDNPEELGEADWLVAGESGWVAIKYGTAGSVAWENVVGAPDFLTDAQGSIDGDSKEYVRKNGAWIENSGGASLWQQNGSDIYYSDGNVGIGTDTPAETLTVQGPILSNRASHGNNQDEAYMIAAAKGYDGSTTNWATHGYQHRLKSNDTGGSRITVDTNNGEIWSLASGGVMKTARQGSFDKPDDAWATNGWYGIHDYGAFTTAGSGNIVMQAGGYRGPSNEWRQFPGYEGAAQIQCNAGNGNILIRAASQKDAGSSYTPPLRMQINGSGEVGIGQAPVASTAAAQLANWQSELDTILEDNPDLEVRAAVRQATGDEFDVMPTEEQVAAWMETRAAGDQLQVNGNIFAQGGAQFNGTLRFGDTGIDAPDANAATKSGFYSTADLSTVTNWPDVSGMKSGPGALQTFPSNNANNAVQFSYGIGTERAFFRTYRASSWKDWREFVTADIDGTLTRTEKVTININENGGQTLTVKNSNATASHGVKVIHGGGGTGTYPIFVESNAGVETFRLDGTGSVTAKGGVSASEVSSENMKLSNNGRIFRTDSLGIGLYFEGGAENAIVPTNNAGNLINNGPSLGNIDRSFNDAFFRGTVSANELTAVRVYRSDSNGCGLEFQTSNEVRPIDSAGELTDGSMDIGNDSYRFNNAHFSGTVRANDFRKSSEGGIAFSPNNLLPIDQGGSTTSGLLNLGTSSNKFNNAHFSGTVDAADFTVNGFPKVVMTDKDCNITAKVTIGGKSNQALFFTDGFNTGGSIRFGVTGSGGSAVGHLDIRDNSNNKANIGVQGNPGCNNIYVEGTVYKNGGTSPVIATDDLIETLSTLRNATKDETTVEGLRDAIGNAVGGLIERFEAMQSVATQEIN